MGTDEIVQTISKYCSTQPIMRAWLFGSFARNEERDDSDVDIMVEFDRENSKVGLLKYSSIILDLEELLQRDIDLVEKGALLPWVEASANKDMKMIYERTSSR